MSGASIARSLVLRGWDVTLVEQYAPGHRPLGVGRRHAPAAHGPRAGRVVHAERVGRAGRLDRAAGAHRHADLGAGRRRVVRAQRGRLRGGSSRELLGALGIPVEWLSPDDAARPLPHASAPTISRACSTSPPPACCTRGAPRSCSSTRRSPAGRGSRPGRVLPAAAPDTDVVVWACGAWLPALFPQQVEIRISRRDVFFFGADASWRGTPGFCDYDGGFYGHGELDGPRRQGRVGRRRARGRPGYGRAAPRRAARARRPRLRGPPLPRPRGRAGDRLARVPVRRDHRHALRRRPASRARERGGSSAAARATASSTARLSASTSPTASRAGASRSRSTRSASAPATPACAPAVRHRVRTGSFRSRTIHVSNQVRSLNLVRDFLVVRRERQGREPVRKPRRTWFGGPRFEPDHMELPAPRS